MALLAIKGHATRGKEVIELLEMLGGKNHCKYWGNDINKYYYIDDKYRVIEWCHECTPDSDFVSYTLEEFLERFPYKVGDKVVVTAGKDTFIDVIGKMKWEEEINTVLYVPQNIKINVYPEKLQPYKELRMALDDDDKLASEATIKGKKIVPPDGYLIGKITQVDNGMLIEYIEKKPQYPKTYVECAKILNCFGAAHIDGYKCELLEQFQELLICRDAYWKIAGDWKPNWGDTFIYSIGSSYGVVGKRMVTGSGILAFPTEEMRDAFFENFKELIELCKELL